MIFGQSQAVVYVRPDSLDICQSKPNSCESLALNPSIITSLEVVDSKALQHEIISFLNHSGISKQNAIIVLSPELVFQASIPTSAESSQSEIFSFFNNIPLNPENIARKVLNTKDATYLFSTNIQLFSEVAQALIKAGWEVEAVVPATMFFEAKSGEPLTEEQVVSILRNRNRISLGNFLHDASQAENITGIENQPAPSNQSLAIIALVLSLMLLAGALIFAFYTLNFSGPSVR